MRPGADPERLFSQFVLLILPEAVSQYLVQAGLEGGVRLRSVGLKSELYSASLEEHGLSMAGLIEQARELLDLRSP